MKMLVAPLGMTILVRTTHGEGWHKSQRYIEERNPWVRTLGYPADNLGRPNGRDAGVVKFGVWVGGK
jgi:hypothetical protein